MMNSSGSGKPQLFINFRGKSQRANLVSFLKSDLEKIGEVNVFIDENEIRGKPIKSLFKRIRESSIALVIFSDKYPESCWCLDELAEIKNQMDIGSIVAFPIFYKVEPESIKSQTGYFLNTLLKTEDYVRKNVDRSSHKSILETEARIWGWRQALVSVGGIMGITHQHCNDRAFVDDIVVEAKRLIHHLSSPSNDLIFIKKPLMHPQEAATWFLQGLNLNISGLEDLIAEPTTHINDVFPLGTDQLVFLDLISLQNPIIAQRLSKPGRAGRILLVLLGSLQYYNGGFAFKPLLLPKKSQHMRCNNNVIFSSQEDQSSPSSLQGIHNNDNLQNHLPKDNISDADMIRFSAICNILKQHGMITYPPSQRVFISFGEKQLAKSLVSSLKTDLKSSKILVSAEYEMKSGIKDSSVAIVIFSTKYPNLLKCLDDLVEIKKLMDAGKIDPFPVFYNVEAEAVKEMKGWFRNKLLKIEDKVRKSVNRRDDNSILNTEAKIWGWRQAILSIASRDGLSYKDSRSYDVLVSDVVTEVKKLIASRERQTTNHGVERPLMYGWETEAATTVVKSLDDDLIYSLTSFLQALNLEFTDIKGFKKITNGLVSIRLREHTNLLFYNLSSYENLTQFQQSNSIKFLTKGFASGATRSGVPLQMPQDLASLLLPTD